MHNYTIEVSNTSMGTSPSKCCPRLCLHRRSYTSPLFVVSYCRQRGQTPVHTLRGHHDSRRHSSPVLPSPPVPHIAAMFRAAFATGHSDQESPQGTLTSGPRKGPVAEAPGIPCLNSRPGHKLVNPWPTPSTRPLKANNARRRENAAMWTLSNVGQSRSGPQGPTVEDKYHRTHGENEQF